MKNLYKKLLPIIILITTIISINLNNENSIPLVENEKLIINELNNTKENKVNDLVNKYPDYIYQIKSPKINSEIIDLFNRLENDQYLYGKDKYNRPSYAIAKLNENSIKRNYGNKQKFVDNPVGWNINKEVNIKHPNYPTYHGWFWNRSHLIADQLGGPSLPKNAIKATRTQNVGGRLNNGGMRIPEQRAYDYILNTKKPLLYIVQPIYKNDFEIIPRQISVHLYNDEVNEKYVTLNIAYGYIIDYEEATYYKIQK